MLAQITIDELDSLRGSWERDHEVATAFGCILEQVIRGALERILGL